LHIVSADLFSLALSFLWQVFNYLMLLQEAMGIAAPIAILTTFAEWKVFTLDNGQCREYLTGEEVRPTSPTQTSAEEMMILTPSSARAKDRIDEQVLGLPCSPRHGAPGTDPDAATTTTTTQGQMVRCMLVADAPNPYDSDNMAFFAFIASALMKMFGAVQVPTKLNDPNRYVYQMRDQASTSGWVRAPSKRLTFAKSPNPTTKIFYVLQHLGAGKDGRVWLARSENGAVCAIKVPLVLGSAEKELGVWQAAYGGEAFLRKLDGVDCLIMPLVLPLHKLRAFAGPETDFVTLCRPLIARAIAHFASSKLLHCDVRLSNMGFRLNEGKPEVILFDFLDVKTGTQVDPLTMWQALFPGDDKFAAEVEAEVSKSIRDVPTAYVRQL
jgi:hypothetical protein